MWVSHVGMILSTVTVLLIAKKSLSTSPDLLFKETACYSEDELSTAAQYIENARSELSRACSSSSDPDSGLPRIADAPDLCENASIDAITRTEDQTTYVFKGEFYWKVWKEPSTHGIANEKPKIISKDWDGLPGNIDAALTLYNGTTYFFKGSKYWTFSNQVKEPGDAKLIRDGFPGAPDSPDAAFVWGHDNSVYFFKGTKYYRLSQENFNLEQSKPIKNVKGLPSYVDAAFQWDNRVAYVFKCDVYYRLNETYLEVHTAWYHYPSLTSPEWFRC